MNKSESFLFSPCCMHWHCHWKRFIFIRRKYSLIECTTLYYLSLDVHVLVSRLRNWRILVAINSESPTCKHTRIQGSCGWLQSRGLAAYFRQFFCTANIVRVWYFLRFATFSVFTLYKIAFNCLVWQNILCTLTA